MMPTVVRERPILFSGPMVNAILADTKTQTRRLAVSRDDRLRPGNRWGECLCRDIDPSDTPCVVCGERFGDCRYGLTGDRLWVRESWNVSGLAWGKTPREAAKIAAPSAWRYAATDDGSWKHGWKPSIHMPRAASRITLEVTQVRVERLQDISEADARAEGVKAADAAVVFQQVGLSAAGLPRAREASELSNTARGAFACLWDKINGDRAPWSSDPFVWVVTFRRIEA